MRTIEFDQHALQDMVWWVKNDRKVALRILNLVLEVQRTPFEGTGKPEPLKHQFTGAWSRRITDEHRLVYTVSETRIRILACRAHY